MKSSFWRLEKRAERVEYVLNVSQKNKLVSYFWLQHDAVAICQCPLFRFFVF